MVLLLLVLTAGCHGLRGTHDSDWVADELQERIGHSPADGHCGFSLPPGVDCADGLTDVELAALALWNNSAFQVQLQDLGLSRADLTQARQIPNPQLNLLFPSGRKELEFTIDYALHALWFRGKQIKIAENTLAQTSDRLVQAGLDLLRDVRLAVADVQLARDRRYVAEENAKLRQRIVQIAEARLKLGEASRFDVDTAKLEDLRSTQSQASAKHDVDQAEQRLALLIGNATAATPLPLHIAKELPDASLEVEALVLEAIDTRPDVVAWDWAAEAARQRLRIARTGQFGLVGMVDANAKTEGFEIGPGINLSVPIFNRNQGKIARAQAELELALRQRDAARDRVVLDVRQASSQYVQARDDLRHAEKTLRPEVEATMRRLEKAYREGLTSLLILLEGTQQLHNAWLREAQLRSDVRRAWAQLERAVGRHLDRSPVEKLPAPRSKGEDKP